jgi:hypothetical protein
MLWDGVVCEGGVGLILLLKEKCAIDLEGKKSSIIHRIEHQTEKAVLLAVVHKLNGEEKTNSQYWLPKSQILIDNEKPDALIDIQKAAKIEIPEWLWKERRPIT